jgi:para-nitrobenzyl esterase
MGQISMEKSQPTGSVLSGNQQASEVFGYYGGGNTNLDELAARELGGDLTIIFATWSWLAAQKKTGRAEVYRYRFDRAPLTPAGWFGSTPGREAGAFHSCEIPYVFNNLDALPWVMSDDDRGVARSASRYWCNFIKSGNPNGPGLVEWPSFRRSDNPWLAIEMQPSVSSDGDSARYEFLADVTNQGRVLIATEN